MAAAGISPDATLVKGFQQTSMAWHKHNIEISKIIDGKHRADTTHEIDHVRQTDKGSFALEIEWNNKVHFLTVIWKTSGACTQKAQSAWV